ncbi:hypothetical protein JL721_11625 [Aureococcus anophagefferens]|nr:hypothetical protein JL721_11625 [Aureococcus anophagefferens]
MQQRKRTLTDPEDKAAAAKMDPVTASPLLAPSAAIAEIDDDFVLEPEKAGLPTARSWCACATLSLSVLLCMSTWLSSSVVLQYLVDAFSVSEGHGSFFTIAVQLGFVACCLAQAGTQLPDRANCRWLMCFGGLLAVAANLAMLACRAFWQALLARFATGVAMALVYPPATKVLATWFVAKRGLAMSFLVGAIAPGSGLANLVKAVRAPRSSGRRGAASWRTSAHRGNKKAVLAILGYMGHSWELYGAWSWLPHFLGSEVFEPQAAALLSFAAIAVGAVSCVALGDCGDRYGRCKMSRRRHRLFALASLAPGALLAVAFMERLDRLAAPKAAALAPDSDDRRFVAAA